MTDQHFLPWNASDSAAFSRWRESKLASAPNSAADLIVEVEDAKSLSVAEQHAIIARVRTCSMAIYAQRRPNSEGDDKATLRNLGACVGLIALDSNSLADDDGITPLAVHRDGTRARYIPYTDRPIAWHTDGYYNPVARRVRGLTLHCARPAATGGENRLMDPEMLYLLLRDEDPALVTALMRDDAMTIPGNDEDGMIRTATPGPVFWVDGDGQLCMRYTARSRNVEWHPDPTIQAAVAAIRRITDSDSPHVFTARLEAGWGLLSNNVLHTREKFEDDPTAPRLLYRARYHDRIKDF
jgi:Taurine catabolism dioxygenase TauD, TfdA family